MTNYNACILVKEGAKLSFFKEEPYSFIKSRLMSLRRGFNPEDGYPVLLIMQCNDLNPFDLRLFILRSMCEETMLSLITCSS